MSTWKKDICPQWCVRTAGCQYFIYVVSINNWIMTILWCKSFTHTFSITLLSFLVTYRTVYKKQRKQQKLSSTGSRVLHAHRGCHLALFSSFSTFLRENEINQTWSGKRGERGDGGEEEGRGRRGVRRRRIRAGLKGQRKQEYFRRTGKRWARAER